MWSVAVVVDAVDVVVDAADLEEAEEEAAVAVAVAEDHRGEVDPRGEADLREEVDVVVVEEDEADGVEKHIHIKT